MTPEERLLGRVLSADLSWASAGGWDASRLTQAADDHGVVALLWTALEGSTGPGAALREHLAPRVRAYVVRELMVERELRGVSSQLARAGVRALLTKGAALAYTAYEQPWLRPRTDTDILVATDDVPSAQRALEACGYVRSDALTSGTLVSHQIAFERVDQHGLRHVVDLHWKIVNPQILADALVFEDLWRGARAAPLGPDARVPSPVASLILACVHRLAHHQGLHRLIWLYDLRVLSATFENADWESLGQTARAGTVAGLCLDGLRQARDVVGARLPERLEVELATAAPLEPSQRYLARTIGKRDVLVSDLAALKGWGARLRLLREHAFPPVAFIRQRYGVRHPALLPALYLHRLVVGAYRWVRP
jgi:hypothetical protein